MSRKTKYTKAFEIKAVKAVLKEKKGINALSDQLGIDRTDLQKWISYYKEYGAVGLTPRTSNVTYSKEFKLQVVRSINKKGLSFKEASLNIYIPAHSTVSKWHLIYEK